MRRSEIFIIIRPLTVQDPALSMIVEAGSKRTLDYLAKPTNIELLSSDTV